MKLCPQCEFIYEDDQNLCDMDGETLVYDTRVGVFPETLSATTGARPAKSRRKSIAVPVVAGLVFSAVLFIAYCASSPLLHLNVASPIRKPEAKETSLRQQLTPPPDGSQSQPGNPPQSPTNSVVASESVNSRAEWPAKLVSESARSQRVLKATDKVPKANADRLTIARALPPLPQVRPLPRLSPPRRLETARTESQLSGSNQQALVVEVKPAKVEANKRSKLTTLFKKTTRLLKKPFRF
jgi:hypothetical protein